MLELNDRNNSKFSLKTFKHNINKNDNSEKINYFKQTFINIKEELFNQDIYINSDSETKIVFLLKDLKKVKDCYGKR